MPTVTNTCIINQRLLFILFLFASYQFSNAQSSVLVAGNGSCANSGDGGAATMAGIFYPRKIAFNTKGDLYITTDHVIRKVDGTTGRITTVAGNGTDGYSGDGGLATAAALKWPYGICVDKNNNIYISDVVSPTVRRIDATTGFITTIAGNGTKGSTGDGGLAVNAKIDAPYAICVDNDNNLYIAEAGTSPRIRKVNAATGIISTIAGTGVAGSTGDGGLAINASIYDPESICVDNRNNIYIAQTADQTRIRKIDAGTGIITTVAGTGKYAHSGDGGPATSANLWGPSAVTVDAIGNIYIAEYANGKVRKVDVATGIITTIIDAGIVTFPTGLCMDPDGYLYVVGLGNCRIFKQCPKNGAVPGITIAASTTAICGPTAVTFTATFINGGGNPAFQWKVNGAAVSTNSATYTTTTLNAGDVVTCELTSTAACAANNKATSNAIIMAAAPGITPVVTISADKTAVCAGSPVTFTAVNQSGNANPSYQWMVNGVNVGTNSTIFTATSLTDGAAVECIMTVPQCAPGTSTKDLSNSITINVTPASMPSVTISSSASTICQGDAVRFDATGVSAGTTPTYEWQVNGSMVGSNASTYTTTGLRDGDMVTCKLYIDPLLACAASPSVVSNAIRINSNITVTPSIQINVSSSSICFGQAVSFTATPTNGGTNPLYQWKVNGVAVGTNSATYTSSTLDQGDMVSCELTSTSPCAVIPTVSSNAISMNVTHEVTPEVSITADRLSICEGASVRFTAINQSGHQNPVYQWQVNGTNAGTNSTSFTATNLANGAIVQCIMTVPHCVAGTTKDHSDPIVITVSPIPFITFEPATITVDAGQQLTLRPRVSGATSYAWTPANAVLDASVMTPLTVPLTNSITYQLKASSSGGCEASKELTIHVFKDLYMPNSFSPNGDGLNDIFRIPPHTTLTLTDFSIFDRWGNKVFTTTDVNSGWNGKNKGKLAPVGSYIYTIQGATPKGKVVTRGTFILLR